MTPALQNLIALMADGEFHSGEVIGEQLQVSRAAVWKQLQKLSAYGLEVQSVKGKGYSLGASIQLLNQDLILARLPGEVSERLASLTVFPEVDSTNGFLLSEAQAGRGECGSVVFAEYQTAGRGRRGRRWHSPFGCNLYFSLLWEFDQGAVALEGLSLAVGVGVARVLRRLGVPVELKWPNDLLVAGAKLGGVLLEMTGDPAGHCQVVVGVGLNLSMTKSDDTQASIDQSWTAVDQYVEGVSRNQLAVDLVSELLPLLSSYTSDSFEPYKKDWVDWDAFNGKLARVVSGERVTEGFVRGVADNGALLFEVDGVVMSVYGGELSLRAADDIRD